MHAELKEQTIALGHQSCTTTDDVLRSLSVNGPAREHLQSLIFENRNSGAVIDVPLLLRIAKIKEEEDINFLDAKTAEDVIAFLVDVRKKFSLCTHHTSNAAIPLRATLPEITRFSRALEDLRGVQQTVKVLQNLLSTMITKLTAVAETTSNEPPRFDITDVARTVETCSTDEVFRALEKMKVNERTGFIRDLLNGFKADHHRKTTVASYWCAILFPESPISKNIIVKLANEKFAMLPKVIEHCKMHMLKTSSVKQLTSTEQK